MSRICMSAILLLAFLSGASTAGGVPCRGGQGSWASGSTPQARRPDWLVKHDEVSWRAGLSPAVPRQGAGVLVLGTPLLQQACSVHARPESTPLSPMERIGMYGGELGLAALGACVAGAGTKGVSCILADYERSHGLLPGAVLALDISAFLLTGPLLSATGAYLGGRLAGQEGSFWHTLVGSLAGGAIGTAGAFGYARYWSSRHSYWSTGQTVVWMGCGLVPASIGAVVAYNAWRKNAAN